MRYLSSYKSVLVDILIIDDNSSDGTANLVEAIQNDRVKNNKKTLKMGLGTAYITGFNMPSKIL
jgi:glycosyltransferase involved in cell wall biosynthesis